MLKLTHSFYRYSRVTCENIICYSTIVERHTHLSCRGETCVTWNGAQLLGPLGPASFQSRLLSNIKKRSRVKKSHVNANATKIHKQMNNSVQPTVTNVCYGGQFEISTDGTSSGRHSDSDNDNKQTNIPPDFRIWEPVGKKSSCCEGFRFRVMSYNVLAQYLLECHPYLYTNCGLQNLNWNSRAAKIYDEILSLSPDILCLQEVQVSHLNTFYSKFEEMGYCGIFKQKTGERQDGCAIYFKKSLFDLQDHISVEFYQPEMPILNRDNIGLMAKLAPKCSPGTPVVVATTHLLYNPKRTDVRLAQLQVLLAEIDRFAYINDGKEWGYLPIILAGDFNSTPESAVVELLDRGHVSASPFRDNSDWKKIGVTDNCQHLSVYLNRQKGVSTDSTMIKIYNSGYPDGRRNPGLNPQQHKELFNSGYLAHPLHLKSVYGKVKHDGHIEATTFQDYWVTVDYIYFGGRNGLKLVERLRLPTAAECAALGKLPNDHLGSDHLALAATFELNILKSSL
ncbi:protein angel-like isoform X1 [Maniola hyperantus]|uniref:protein angel-like isoform X1 n=2 Tax=Aphantopus hyperantus TaxID=2795564 RepID=UPI001568513C|nr:protein angel isoform X1 [Maniola hyperantus]XP_034839395.1 protein angel isoform X1 [Maniola hyperantus]